MHDEEYHYLECGLDDVYLVNGFERTESARGTSVAIRDVDTLHRAIGTHLCRDRKDLNGKEIRFLRRELLMSQRTLAHLFDVGEQTVHRWETGKASMSRTAEALLRLLYMERMEGSGGRIRDRLNRIADLEDEIDHVRGMVFEIAPDEEKQWRLAA